MVEESIESVGMMGSQLNEVVADENNFVAMDEVQQSHQLEEHQLPTFVMSAPQQAPPASRRKTTLVNRRL